MTRRQQTNVRLDAAHIDAIEASPQSQSAYVRQAIAERIDRDAGRSPARVALAPFVWGVLEVAVFCGLITPAELSAEAAKYEGRDAGESPPRRLRRASETCAR